MTGKTVGKKVVSVANSLVNLAVLIAILLLLAIASYAMWDSNQVHKAADAQQYAIYKPSGDDVMPFEELRKINPEVFSWLTVYGTKIDYPVAQAADNAKYVNTNARGEYALSGSVFLDCNNSPKFSEFNSILYGHHMDQQAMFGDLERFSDKEFFDSRRYGNLFYDGDDHGLEFFAFLHTDAYNSSIFTANVQGIEPQERYLAQIFENAMHSRNINVSTSDRIVLLTTCSAQSTNGRDILVARISDNVYPNTFEDENNNSGGLRIGVVGELWERLPLWGKIFLPLLLLILLLIVVATYMKRKRTKEQLRKEEMR